MTDFADELARREAAARQAIKTDADMEDQESGAARFVAFHLEELDPGYWQAQLGTQGPDPYSVLGLLELREHWGGEDEMETFDFMLPGDVSDYVISVNFNDAGRIQTISMES